MFAKRLYTYALPVIVAGSVIMFSGMTVAKQDQKSPKTNEQTSRMPGPGYGPGYMMGPGYGYGYRMGPGYGHMMRQGYGHGPHMGGSRYGWGHPHMGSWRGRGPGWGHHHRGYGQPWSRGQQSELTIDDVKKQMERRLSWRNNPNLKLGKIEKTKDDTITVEIVTKDGSLVRRWDVNPKTGQWRPVG